MLLGSGREALVGERRIGLVCERRLRGRENVREKEDESYWDREGETNVKCFTEISSVKKFYTNLPKLSWLIENIFILTRYFTIK